MNIIKAYLGNSLTGSEIRFCCANFSTTKAPSGNIARLRLWKNHKYCYRMSNDNIKTIHSWRGSSNSLPTHEEGPISQRFWTKPKARFNQPSVLQNIYIITYKNEKNRKLKLLKQIKKHFFYKLEIQILQIDRQTFIRFSIISLLFTATSTTIQRLNSPAWLCSSLISN